MKVHDLREKFSLLTASMDKLKACSYEHGAFAEHISAIQVVVDDLNLAEYSNLGVWVTDLSKEVRPTECTPLDACAFITKRLTATYADVITRFAFSWALE